MYRISKVLNHNTIIGIQEEDHQEYLIMGKGIGFGKKVTERVELPDEVSMYSLKETTRRGSASKLARSIPPEYLEVADLVLQEAERVFGKIDQSVLFPMADHIEYAVKRIQSGEAISNPLTEDIRLLFYSEYKVALTVVPILKKKMGIDMDEHEVGYIALHVHTAIEKEELSQAMQIAQAVRDCVFYVENVLDKKLNMNDYMGQKFPEEFQMAAQICEKLGKDMRCQFSKVEIGYLAMHLQRILTDEELNE